MRWNPDDYLSQLAQRAELGDIGALFQLLKEAVRRNDEHYIYDTILEIAMGLEFQAIEDARLQRKNQWDSDPNCLYMRQLVGLITNVYWWIRWSRSQDPEDREDANFKINKLLNGEYDNPPPPRH